MRKNLQPVATIGERIIYRSSAMAAVLGDVAKAAPIDVTVLLLGESGTGKELLAQEIHERSARADRPFITINCPAIPETLLESELFGYEKGAFTGAQRSTPGKIELADGGTLFLDEIGDIPPSTQVKLLRFMQSHTIERVGGTTIRKVDVRVVCATHRNLEQLTEEGQFRLDLYYRINQIAVRIPSVRERPGDAVLLADHFLTRFAAEFNRPLRGFSREARELIAKAPWPGNVRQIENRVKRAVVMAQGPLVRVSDLDMGGQETDDTPLDLRSVRRNAEVEVVQRALEQTRSNISKAARLLGISRPTLYSIIRQHGLL